MVISTWKNFKESIKKGIKKYPEIAKQLSNLKIGDGIPFLEAILNPMIPIGLQEKLIEKAKEFVNYPKKNKDNS
jgi:hypothetical protein